MSDLSIMFWSKVDTSAGPDGCWPWMGTRDKFGYGKIHHGTKHLRAHRVALEIANGQPIPDGLLACHSCDNPPCVNPNHLFIGTHLDNQSDKARKGRSAAGARHGSHLHPETVQRGDNHPRRLHPELFARGQRAGSHLNEEQVKEIRRRYADGETQTALSREFPISQANISDIVLRKSWAHVL